ncbi:hypothetical protein [Arthrobacter sp.]|nr:hypothetical protein [Arthrobacter sp.]
MSVCTQLDGARGVTPERSSARGRIGWWPRAVRGAVGNWPDPLAPTD